MGLWSILASLLALLLGCNRLRLKNAKAGNPLPKIAFSSSSALERARALQAPIVSSTMGGESDNLNFWEQHEDLFQNAWREWAATTQGIPKNDSTNLPDLAETQMTNASLYQQIQDLWQYPSVEKEESLQQDFWEEPIKGVFVCQEFLSTQGIRRIRAHLEAASNSGIPTRRPNGMNRYGLVLDEETQGGVSYPELDAFREWLVDTYVRPLGRMFFPDYIGNQEDDESSYAFTIHYEPTEKKGDVQLNEHSDASVVTININLNLPGEEDEGYEGSSLIFVNDDDEHNNDTGILKELRMEPGMAVLHRGLHRHQASPIERGQRHQLIVWLMGRGGYVRVAPYKASEQMSVSQRWTKPPSSSRGASDDEETTTLWNLLKA
jgi:hypothetical protein